MENKIKQNHIPLKRRSSEEWRKIVEDWQHSGESARVYAQKHGLALFSLQKWGTKYRRHHLKRRTSTALTRFIPLNTSESDIDKVTQSNSISQYERLEIEWPGGHRMRFNGQLTVEKLQTLIQTMAKLAC